MASKVDPSGDQKLFCISHFSLRLQMNIASPAFIVVPQFPFLLWSPDSCSVIFFNVYRTVVVETEVSLRRLLATWELFDTAARMEVLCFMKMLPTPCQPSQKLTSGWSGRIYSRLEGCDKWSTGLFDLLLYQHQILNCSVCWLFVKNCVLCHQ